jgi:hypothetical protein
VKLTEGGRLCSVFHQDFEAARVAHASLEALMKVLGDHVISHGL